MSEIERELKEKGIYMTLTEGDSMYPMLKTGTRVLIGRPPDKFKKYDIPVYRKLGHYTMHRIVKVKKNGYIICGDNRTDLEKNVTDDDIIGMLLGYYKKDVFVEANSETCINFGKKARRSFCFRYIKNFMKRVFRKIGIKNNFRE